MPEKRVVTLKIADLEPSNYREEGDTKDLEASLAKLGQQEPITVENAGGKKYKIKHGHRRVKALRAIGRDEVTAIVTEPDDDKRKRLIEQVAINNVTKADSYDLAVAVKKLVDEGYSHADIGEALGRDRTYATMLYNLLIDNVPYTAFVSGRDLLFHKEDQTGTLFFLTKGDIEKAGHKVFDFVELQGLGENAPSIFNCKPLVQLFKELDQANTDHVRHFNLTMAYMIKKGLRDKTAIDSVALRMKAKLFAKKLEAKTIDPGQAATRIASIFAGGKIEDVKALQKAIRKKLRDNNIPYEVTIRYLDEAHTAHENG